VIAKARRPLGASVLPARPFLGPHRLPGAEAVPGGTTGSFSPESPRHARARRYSVFASARPVGGLEQPGPSPGRPPWRCSRWPAGASSPNVQGPGGKVGLGLATEPGVLTVRKSGQGRPVADATVAAGPSRRAQRPHCVERGEVGAPHFARSSPQPTPIGPATPFCNRASRALRGTAGVIEENGAGASPSVADLPQLAPREFRLPPAPAGRRLEVVRPSPPSGRPGSFLSSPVRKTRLAARRTSSMPERRPARAKRRRLRPSIARKKRRPDLARQSAVPGTPERHPPPNSPPLRPPLPGAQSRTGAGPHEVPWPAAKSGRQRPEARAEELFPVRCGGGLLPATLAGATRSCENWRSASRKRAQETAGLPTRARPRGAAAATSRPAPCR